MVNKQVATSAKTFASPPVARKWTTMKNRTLPRPYFGPLKRIPVPPSIFDPSEFIKVRCRWDFENLPVPETFNLNLLAPNIQSALHKVDRRLQLDRIYAVGSPSHFEDNAKHHGIKFQTSQDQDVYFRQLEWNGIKVSKVPKRIFKCVTCPPKERKWITNYQRQDVYSRFKDMADSMIIHDMMSQPLTELPPSAVLLISGDKDFASSLHFLAKRRYQIFVALKDRSDMLEEPSRLVWNWTHLQNGEAPTFARF